MKRLLPFLTVILLFTSCHDIEEYENTRSDNFECLWRLVDEHYCFFGSNDVDWNAVHDRYRQRADTAKTARSLFNICGEMLNELRDGHVNLSSSFDVSYYREWWSLYPQDFNLRTLQQYYLDMNWHTVCGMYYKILSDDIGYIYYHSFNYTVGDGNLTNVLNSFRNCKGVIIDIRNNGGGELSNVHTIVGHFIEKKFIGSYTCYKTGPGHDDFSAPYGEVYKPCTGSKWLKPVVLLTNRSCFSAANDFVAVMKSLPQVTVIGARTGGGGGMPFTYDLPIGWTVRMSVSPSYDSEMNLIESGIEPDVKVTSPDNELAQGKDRILDEAIKYLKEGQGQ